VGAQDVGVRERVAETAYVSMSTVDTLAGDNWWVGPNFLACDRDQQFLMPPSVAEWLAEDHLAWFVLDVVDELDLDGLYAGYRADGWGHPAHEPSMMLALLLYAYCLGERSSRRIEARCRDDVAFRVITANSTPDHATIARFRVRHEDVLKGLLVQSLRLCQAAGLVRVGVVALDGTKIAAQASMNATRSREQIEAEVAAMLAEAAAVDAAEALDRGRCGECQGPVLRGGQVARRRRLLEAKAQLEAEDQAAQQAYERKVSERAAREQATGRRMRGRKPQPPAPDPGRRVNISDPDSRMMPTKGGWLQGYNAQIVTTVEQIIVAAQVTSTTNDQPLLHPMLAATAQTLHAAGIAEPITTVLADAGYCTDANLAAADLNGPQLLMPVYNLRKDRDLDHARDQLGNRAPKPLSAKQRLEQELATERGQALYRLRSQSVEATFGQVKDARRCRRFQRRGQAAADSEWKLICATHNLLKLWRQTRSQRRHADVVPAPEG
jgi:transposase